VGVMEERNHHHDKNVRGDADEESGKQVAMVEEAKEEEGREVNPLADKVACASRKVQEGT